ncbi:MAG: hypothetical protein QM774_10195 [Gordonia sp. (in: high G+C Gram-positive bacteria)]|uniref:hypothetical protein n=1 Tax=Gordonia sp. (in: high G+C Gram-positive bacteria) TaxID=84139 RepID=UPI0039E37709
MTVPVRYRLRAVANVLNPATPAGLLIAVAGRTRISRGPGAGLADGGYAEQPLRSRRRTA